MVSGSERQNIITLQDCSFGIEVSDSRPSLSKEIVEFANSWKHVDNIILLYFVLFYTGTEDQKTFGQ